jgi:hypothetical protein
MYLISHIWQAIQCSLFPVLEEEIGPLTDKQQELVAILELAHLEKCIQRHISGYPGRPQDDRRFIARAFIAKMVYNFSTTRVLIDQLKSSPTLRRICGWERRSDIPSEATFSRAFAEFAACGLPSKAHAAMIEQHEKPRLIGHMSTDSTAIIGREKAKKKKKLSAAAKKAKRGRPKKGEPRIPKEPSRLEQQRAGMALEDMLQDLPQAADVGTKIDSKGNKISWRGFKLHVTWADGEIPISCVLTSASVHDSQVAIPLMQMSAHRVTSLYDLMDSAYDALQIKEMSRKLNHIPIIDHNPRRGEKKKMEPATAERYKERSTAERGNSLLTDNLGGSMVRVRGAAKVYAHLMFGIVALTAIQLLRLAT